jgi:hypothetical protein
MINWRHIIIFAVFWFVCFSLHAQEECKSITVDIDELPRFNLQPKEMFGRWKDSEIYFFRIHGIDVDRSGFLYITDSNNRVLVLNNHGKVVRVFGREGAGPGEFRQPAAIKVTEKQIYVYEYKNARIQIFDRNFRYISTLPAMFGIISKFAVDNKDRFIYLPNDSDLKRKGILLFSVNRPHQFVGSFFDLKLPDKRQYTVMTLNAMAMEMDKKNHLYVMRKPFPTLFVFDDQNRLMEIIKFKGKPVRDLAKPLKGAKGVNRSGIIKIFCVDFCVSENGDILILLGGRKMLFFDVHRRKWLCFIMKPPEVPGIDDTGYFSGVALHKKRIFLVDMATDMIVCYSLPEKY